MIPPEDIAPNEEMKKSNEESDKYQIPDEEYSGFFYRVRVVVAVVFKDINAMNDKGYEHIPAEDP